MMIIAVNDTKVYRFEGATIECTLYDTHAEIVVKPQQRKFILRLTPQIEQAMHNEFPQYTPRQRLSLFIIKALETNFLPVDEEIL
jgi:hypothetical protein